MGDERAALPIKRYVLTIHDPDDWKRLGPTRGSFESKSQFVPSSSPFPIPQVGHEVAIERATDLPDERLRTRRIVNRVSHRIRYEPDGWVSHVDVYVDVEDVVETSVPPNAGPVRRTALRALNRARRVLRRR